jgi:predicted esterase
VRHRLLLPLVAVLVIVAAGCYWPNVIPPGNAPVRYRDPIFNGVTVTSNITYGTAVNLSGQTITLRLDMYQPSGDTITSRPAIVWVHGGSFCCGSKTSPEIVDEATTFSKKGYVNASIDYRLESPGCAGSASNCVAAIQEAAADAQTAVRFLRTNAATYGIDPNRIAIGGSSAGAITALNVGYSSSEDPSASVRAAVSLSGARLFVGTISPGDAPALAFHCTTDPLVRYSWVVNTINSAKAQGLDAFLESWNQTCHVPYAEHRQQIIDQTRNFLWWEMDLARAAT